MSAISTYGDDAQAAAMAAFVRNGLKLDRAAVWIEDRDLYPRTIGADFPKSFEALGGTIALTQSDPEAAGFAAFIDKLKVVTPPAQAIYVASMPDTAPALIAAAREAGIDAPLLSGDGWDADTVVAKSRDASLGDIYFTTHNFLGVDTPEMNDFVEAYTDRFGAAPPNAFAPLGYDTVNLLADAMRRAGSADPAAVRGHLATTNGFPVIEVENGEKSLRWVAPPR